MRKKYSHIPVAMLLVFFSTAQAAPPVVNGLVLDLEANSLAGLPEGSAISLWNDLSGQNNHATGIGNPTVHHHVINGHSVVRLDGDDTFQSPLMSSNDMSFFVVVKGSQYYSLIRWQPGSWFVYHWGGGIMIQTENGNLDGPPTGLVSNKWNIGSAIIDQGPVDGVVVFRNGILTGTWTYSSTWGPLSELYIGSYNGTQEYTIGDIAEIIIYDRALTSTEHEQVGQYLSEKYDITESYPPQAEGPQPADGTVGWSTNITLGWDADANVSTYLVYLGTDSNDVNQAWPDFLPGDFDFSGTVDITDADIFAQQWLNGIPPVPGPWADISNDNDVTLIDYAGLAGDWMQSIILPESFAGVVYSPQFDPNLPSSNQDYFWRVDKVIKGQVYAGQTWSFNCADHLDYNIPPPQHIYTASSNSLTPTQEVLYQSLQGLTARNRPELFIHSSGNNTWLIDMALNYGIYYTVIETIAGPDGPLAWALDNYSSYYSSYLLCDSYGDPDSLTAAVALAAVLPDSLVVDVTDLSFMTSRGIPMHMDMRGKTDKWVWDNYKDSFNKRAVFVQTDEIAAQGAFLRDLPITIGALTWWNSSTTDSDAVFSALLPNIPVHGWDSPAAPGELGAVLYHSQHSMWTAADNWMQNLSTYAGLASLEPEIEFNQPISDNTYTPEDNVHYVAFCMSDMDNINVIFNADGWAQGSSYYGNPNRGNFAMTWGMPLAMIELGPSVMKWWYDHATENDCFIGYSSGMDYFYPSDFPALDRHISHLDDYLTKADLRALCILDHFWPTPMNYENYKHIGEQYAAMDSLRGFFYADVNGDYARYNGKILWFNGKPMVTCRYTLWDGAQYEGVSRTPAQLAASINSLPTDPYSENGYTFVIVHAWTYQMNDVAACISSLDSDVRVVTAEELIEQLYLHNVNP